MHDSNLEQVFANLFSWCRERDFAGYDPFDGLNSRLFQATALKHSRAARLVWTQLFKRSPVNLRRLAGVPVERNSKGIALFALAALANHRRQRTLQTETESKRLLDDLLAMRLDNFSGAAWGYNFDWQSRAFFAPRGTPTVVPTAFAARAFIEAAQVFNEKKYVETARSACDFILQDLNRSKESVDEICFSYSPVDRTQVFNASLLAAETLASVSSLSGEAHLAEAARRAARHVVRQQHEDGSWSYGSELRQSWADNFHTSFIVFSLARIGDACKGGRDEFAGALERGCQFWRSRFFLANGWPRYYHDKLYPVDVHSAASGIVTLLELRKVAPAAVEQAEGIAQWMVRNLHDDRGPFHYQRRRFYTVRTPYMRWGQAWMAYALARLIEERNL